MSGYSSVDRNSPVNTRSANNTPTTPTASHSTHNAKYALQGSSPNDSPVSSSAKGTCRSGVKSGAGGCSGMGGASSGFSGVGNGIGGGAGSYNGISSGNGLHSVSMSGNALFGADDSARDDIGLGECLCDVMCVFVYLCGVAPYTVEVITLVILISSL